MDAAQDSPLTWPASVLKEYSGRVIVFEGNIASGKSFLCGTTYPQYATDSAVPYYPALEVVPPNLLECFIDNPRVYGPLFQISCFEDTRARLRLAHAQARRLRRGFAVVDRGLAGNAVFERVNHAIGNIDDDAHKFYAILAKNAAASVPPPDITVYLDTDVRTITARIAARAAQRGDDTETAYDAEYLAKIDDAHCTWAARALWRGEPLGVIAYDRFPPPECTVMVVAAFLRAARLFHEWPRIVTDPKNMRAGLTEVAIDGGAVARAAWSGDDVVAAWEPRRVRSWADLSDASAGAPLWRAVMHCMMMRVDVYAPQLAGLLAAGDDAE